MKISDNYKNFISGNFGEFNDELYDFADYLPLANFIALNEVCYYDGCRKSKILQSAFEALLYRGKRSEKLKSEAASESERQSVSNDYLVAQRRFCEAALAYGFEPSFVHDVLQAVENWGQCKFPRHRRRIGVMSGTYFHKANAAGIDFAYYIGRLEALALHNVIWDETRVDEAFEKALWATSMRYAASSLFAPESPRLAQAVKRAEKAVKTFADALDEEMFKDDEIKLFVDAIWAWSRCETPKDQPPVDWREALENEGEKEESADGE